MDELRSWAVVSWRLFRYLLYRLRIAPRPIFSDAYREAMIVVGRVLGWPKHLRIVGADRCPKSGPAAFIGNHVKFDDPPVMYRAIYLASGGAIFTHFLGRDDIFADAPFSWLIDYNEVLEMVGGVLFTRESVRLSQLKPIIQILQAGECFGLYPARTRSRTGAVMECPEDSEGPGGVALFVAYARRGRAGVDAPIVPIGRTFNPATKRTAVVFGEPEHLEQGADRAAQRAFDFHLAERIAELIEINAAQILSAVLLTHCVHGRAGRIEFEALERAVASVAAECRCRNVDPAVERALGREVRKTVKYHAKKGMVRVENGTVVPEADAILATPEADYEFRERNPVKFLTNQIIHFPDVVLAVERAASELAGTAGVR
jgi:hypothetical protein